MRKGSKIAALCFFTAVFFAGCTQYEPIAATPGSTISETIISIVETPAPETAAETTAAAASAETAKEKTADAETTAGAAGPEIVNISLDPQWQYADFSVIHTGTARLYKQLLGNGITICVNAGHGTSGGGSVKTLCHPDGSPKVTSGSTSAGETKAAAVSGGTSFTDGIPESKVTLREAEFLRDELLGRGYNVVMIRENDDVQLDNIARTVIANNTSNCHVALHWDSTTSDKGAFFMSVPDSGSYKSMEPVASHWKQHDALGSALIGGLKGKGVKIYSSGSMPMDLTQTSYSTVPSVDLELGDRISDHSDAALRKLALGIADGIDIFFGR